MKNNDLIVCPVCYESNYLKHLSKPYCHRCSADLTDVVASSLSDLQRPVLEVPKRSHGIYNCDWLSFTADFEHYNAWYGQGKQAVYHPDCNAHLHRLMNALDEEREKPDGEGFIDLGLWKFQVLTHGSRSYYYLLHNDDMEIRMARFRSRKEEIFPVFVHFKSQFLWSNIYGLSTLQEKYDLVIEWLEQVFGGKYITSKINRLDLAYHCDDVPSDINADAFVGRHTLDTTRRTHRVVSGVDIGSRRSESLFLRCYNKFIEARATKKEWFFSIWEKAGLNIRKVWNIEFQINREFFADFTLGEGRTKRKLDTVEEVLIDTPAIWYYLTNDWVTYRIPDDGRRTRWEWHPWWANLCNYYECKEVISRHKQMTLPTTELLIPAIRGFLSSYAARSGLSLDDGTLFKVMIDQIKEYEKKAEKSFDLDVGKKRQLMNPEDDLESIGKVAQELEGIEEELHKMWRKGEIDMKPHLMMSLRQMGIIMDESKKKRDAGTSPSDDPLV